MLTFRADMHNEDRNFAYDTLLKDEKCSFMAMGDDNKGNVYFFTRYPLSNETKEKLTSRRIILYLVKEESESQNTK